MSRSASGFRVAVLAAVITAGGVILSAFIVAGSKPPRADLRACQPIARTEVLAIAERYADYQWEATAANLFEGLDPDGIRVKTPKWIPGQTNQGVAYQWGGFSSIEDFETGLAQGRYAGDTDCTQMATSRHAVGVDCSGLVSRCWKLPEKESTRSLPGYCVRLDDTSQLRPGDILNKYDHHVVLFKGYVDGSKSSIECYEARNSRVIRSRRSLEDLRKEGYKPYRYRLITD